MNINKLVKLIDKFVRKKDISLSIANDIEVAIDDIFPDDKYMQDTVEMLVSYRPGGGEYLYNEEHLIARLKKVKEKLNV